MKNHSIKIGIVGTGGTTSIAEKHLEAIKEDGRAHVAAIYNRHYDSALSWINKHSLEAKACRSYDELLDMVDGVVICTPNSSHCQLVKKAIKNRKHFLVEKPLGVTRKECEEVLSLSGSFDGIKMIGFTYRFYSLVNEAKRICAERMGKIYTLNSYYGGKRLSDPNIGVEWRMKKDLSGSGALGDFGSHLLDLASYVTGIKYQSIYAMSEKMIPIRRGECVENDDAASFLCKGEGSMGSFTVSRVGMDDLRLVVTGEGGMLDLSMRGEGKLIYWEKKINGPYTGNVETIDGERENPYLYEMKTFLSGLEGHDVLYPGMDDALYVSRTLFSAEESIEEKKEVLIR